HYNLSFALSASGDYTGALRSARRGMELDPFYVAPSFTLAIDAQHEDADFAVVAELEATSRTELAGDFNVDEGTLDSVFAEREAPVAEPARDDAGGQGLLVSERFALEEGRLPQATSEAAAAVPAGAEPGETLRVAAEAFARQGLDVESQERYRAVLDQDPGS